MHMILFHFLLLTPLLFVSCLFFLKIPSTHNMLFSHVYVRLITMTVDFPAQKARVCISTPLKLCQPLTEGGWSTWNTHAKNTWQILRYPLRLLNAFFQSVNNLTTIYSLWILKSVNATEILVWFFFLVCKADLSGTMCKNENWSQREKMLCTRL